MSGMRMPKYGGSREMSQSPSALSPSPSSHSLALLTTCCCRRPGVSSQFLRKVLHFSSESLKKWCSELFSTGVVPESVEYGFFSSVAAYAVLQFSQLSPYWSFAPQLGHSPLM